MSQDHENTKQTTLSPADAAALDAFLAARASGVASGHLGPMPPESKNRVEKIENLLNLLDQDGHGDAEPEADLTQRTLERVRAARQRERFAQQVQMLSSPRPSLGVGWREIASAVAVFLIGFSLLLPVLERNQQDAQRLQGASNLSSAGVGFSQYAQDNGGLLPRRAIQPGGVWWNVGEPIYNDEQPVDSNTAHLYLLVRRGYVTAETLSNPANPFSPAAGEMTRRHHDWLAPQAVGFSYQNQHRPEPFKLVANPDLVILADRNPIFRVTVGQVVQDPNTPLDAPSRLYRIPGQNMLAADGSVTFTLRPVAPRGKSAGDLIWTARGVERYTGREVPADADDSFLVP